MEDFRCPRCRTLERPVNAGAAERLKTVGRCQGCRASDTLRARPWLLPLFVGFWKGAGFPASDAWFRDLGLPTGSGLVRSARGDPDAADLPTTGERP